MLERVVISEFRCLRHVEAPLRPLTVLIGENDTGKTSFLRALSALSPHARLDPHKDRWFGRGNLSVVGHPSARDPVTRTVQSLVGAVRAQFVHLPADGPAMRSGGAPGYVPELSDAGGQVPALVDWLLRKDRARFEQFTRTIVEQVPGVVDVGIETPDAGSRQIELKLEGEGWLPADQASAGVRLLLFFVALANHPTPPELVLIEEPENGLHPRRLGYVMGLLRGLTEGRFGAPPVQVVLSTHSPYLLDEVDPRVDQVLVFRRQPDGSRVAEPVDTDRLKLFLDDFKLGEVWFNESEAGLVRRDAP